MVELLSIGEDITVSSTQLGNISVIENININEDISLLSILLLDVDDSVLTNETVLVLLPELSINIYDSILIAEDIDIEKVLDISIYDSQNITEDVTVHNTELGSIEVNDVISAA